MGLVVFEFGVFRVLGDFLVYSVCSLGFVVLCACWL